MKRLFTALVLIALVGALVFFGKLWMLTLFAALVAGLAAVEFAGIAEPSGARLPLWWSLGAIALFFLASYFLPQDTVLALWLALFILFTWAAFRLDLKLVLGTTAAGMLSLVYLAFPLALIPQIWNRDNGTALLLFLFLCVWSGDIAALYIGRAFGKRRLAPRLSPGKTWAGSVASVVASVVFGMGLIALGDYLLAHGSVFTRLHTVAPWWQFALLAVLLNIAAQLGDLLESALKRGAGVKDSGTLLPGHGGVLDRIDALLFAAPTLWLVIVLREYFSASSF